MVWARTRGPRFEIHGQPSHTAVVPLSLRTKITACSASALTARAVGRFKEVVSTEEVIEVVIRYRDRIVGSGKVVDVKRIVCLDREEKKISIGLFVYLLMQERHAGDLIDTKIQQSLCLR